MWNRLPGVWICVAIAIASVLFALLATNAYYTSLVVWVLTNAVLASALRFVLQIGELNIATAAFFGIGAYTTAITAVLLGWPFWLTLLLAPLVAGALSALFGWVTLRTKGPYFLLVSFAVTEVVRLIYTQTNAIGGNSGLVGMFPPMAIDAYYPALAVALLAATLFALYGVERSDLGRLFKAIENNDAIPRSVGLNVVLLKVLCVVIAGSAVGLAGGLHAYANNVIAPSDFTFFVAILALAYVKIGGEGHALGPVLGAALLTLVGQWVAGISAWENIFYGAVIVVTLLVFPGGLVGLAARARGLVTRSAR
ncbi:branched-chain amino acid ABC transporter permease [Antarcticimicrobium sp.]|uniref:branched-chain amino acid ABC transporter permease n=1 Tax=Antarcticimicrobium sp. TaxID=2824147 RepID=UPI00261FBD51|nr:branched-chain amino acid ABC transporter permease [Antarcticimicrobium sp.]